MNKVTQSFLIFVLLSSALSAQSQQGMERKSIAFRINGTEKKEGNKWLITIDHGLDAGIKTGQRGEVWGSVRSQVDNHNVQLGEGLVMAVEEHQTKAELETTLPVFSGDIIFLNVSVPVRKNRTPYYDLVSFSINLTDPNGVPYYTADEVLKNDGFGLRTEKFLAMKAAINLKGKELEGDKAVVEAGPHRSQPVWQVMKETDTLQVWYYVYHLARIYTETMGQNIVLTEGYYNYAKEGDVASVGILKDLFLYSNSSAWDKKFEEYKRKLSLDAIRSWKDDAVALRDKGDYQDAHNLLDACIFLGGKHAEKKFLAECLFEKATTFTTEKKHQEAEAQFLIARNSFLGLADVFGVARCDQRRGSALMSLGRPEESLESYLRGKKSIQELLVKKPKEKDYEIEFYRFNSGLADVYTDQKKYESALAVYQSNLELCKANEWTAGITFSTWGVAYVLDLAKRYAECIPYYEEAGVLYLAAADTLNSLDVRQSKASALENLNQYEKAIAALEDALKLTGSPATRRMKARLLKDEARVHRKTGSWDLALTELEGARAGYRVLADSIGQSNVLKDISEVYQGKKKFREAIQAHRERLPLVSRSAFSTQADVYWDIAYVSSEFQKDYPTAIDNYKKSVALYAKTGDTTNWKIPMCNLGVIYRRAGDSVNAYKTHAEAIALTLKNSNRENLTYAYQKAAETYGHFKNYYKKIELLKKELVIIQLLGDHTKIAEVNKSLAKSYEEDVRNYKVASGYYLKLIEEYDQTDNLGQRGDAYWNYAYNEGQNQKKYLEAIRAYEIAFRLYLQASDSSNASVVRSNVGQTYWSLNNFDKAIEAHKEAIFLATRSRNQAQIFKSWNSLADLYKKTGNPVSSSEALKNAASAVEKLNDSTLVSSTYYDLAGTYMNSKDYVRSFEYYDKALQIRRALKDSLNIAATLSGIAALYQTKSEFGKAVDYYQQSLKIKRKIKDKQGESYDLSGLGIIAQSVDANYRKAEDYFMEAIRISREIQNERDLAFTYNRLSYLYRAEGKSKLAEDFKQKAEDIYRKNKNGKELTDLTIWKGFDAFYYYGDQHKGMYYLDQAQAMADTLNDKTVQADIYSVRASVLREMGEFDKALEYTDKGLKLCQEVDNEWGVLSVYVVKGNIYKQRGEYETALRFQFKADSMYQKMNIEYSRYVTYTNIGENYAAQGDYEKALDYYKKANAIFLKANELNENVASIQGLIGQSYFYQNNLPEADKWMKMSMATSDKVGAMRSKMDNLSMLGRLKIAEKKYDEAFKYLSEGVRLSKEKANTLTYLNNLMLMGKLEVERKNFEKAKAPLEESVRTSRSIGKNTTLWESLYLLGVLYKNAGDLPKSKDYLKESVAVIEKIRNNVSGGADAQKMFSADKNIINVYDALIEVLLALGETEEAMTYLQKNNEDNLKAKFKALNMTFESESKNKAMAEERNKKAKLDGIEQQIASEKLLASEKQSAEKLKNLEGIKTIAENEYLKFINQQINVQPELSRFFNNTVQPTQFRKIKKQIPRDMALISYLAGENQLYIFAATTDTVIAKIVTVPREQLARDISGMLNIVKNNMGVFAAVDLKSEVAERREIVADMKQTDKAIKPFEDAYHYLIAPVSKEIAGKTRLCIIPTGALNYIPFQLLGKTLANGKFSLMMNQFSIFYANSTDMLFREANENDKKYHILAFGNPDKSLPSTEREVNDIKRMYPSASIFLREEATEDKAKFASEDFNVMHFATHGNLDYEDFSKSYLTMAGNVSKSEDGLLTLEELWGMEVMNHLNIVVLSACQTAVTKGSNESSPVSPASGFLQNGVKSVVATLWKVDDEATSLLMSDFYNNIKTMDAVDALRAAQIKLSADPKFNHPYFWGAVVLMGDWR